MICSDLLVIEPSDADVSELDSAIATISQSSTCYKIVQNDHIQHHDPMTFLRVGNDLLAHSMNTSNPTIQQCHTQSLFLKFVSKVPWIRNLFPSSLVGVETTGTVVTVGERDSRLLSNWWSSFSEYDWERIREASIEIFPAMERDFFENGGDTNAEDFSPHCEGMSDEQRNQIELLMATLLDEEDEVLSSSERKKFSFGRPLYEVAVVALILTTAFKRS
jgi:hypothetical protein